MSDEITPESVEAVLKEKGVFDEADTKVKATEVDVPEVKEAEVKSEPEHTEAEVEAMDKGWKPDGPKSAEEFLRAEPLYAEIKQRGKELKNLRSQVEELMKHVGGLKKAGYQDKIDVIAAEREDAVVRSDMETLNYLDEELHKVKTEMGQEPVQPDMHPAAVDFVNKYSDILQDYSLESQGIKEFIDTRDKQLASHNLDPSVHIQTLEKDMMAKFPEKFQKESVEKAPAISAVESDTRPVTTKRKAKYTFSDLSSDQKNIYKYMERKGVMEGKEYIKQLVDTGEL